MKRLTDTAVRSIRPEVKRRQIKDGVAPGLELIVQPTGVKSWAWRGRIAGKPRKITLGRYPAHSLVEAREWARDLTRQRDGGIDPIAEKRRKEREAAAAAERDALTVDVAFNGYMKAEGDSRRSASEKRRMYESNFKPAIGHLPLHAVGRDAIEAVIAAKFKTHPLTSNRLVSLIKRFFRWCVTRGYSATRLTADPTAHITKMASEVTRDRVLSDYEIKLFLLALEQEEVSFATPLRLLLLTGARRSEVFAAHWDEFDASSGDWHLPGVRSKNGLPHIVPLPVSVAEIVTAIPRHPRSSLLFPSAANPNNSVSGISKVVKRIRGRMLKLAENEAKTILPWRLHDLRRTVATGMAALRGPDNLPLIAPHEIEAVLNHVSGSRAGVAGIYNRHAYYAEKKRALELWAKKISTIEKQIAAS